MRTVTCGVLFIRDGKILIGHVTGQQHWDIPKGKQEDGETYLQAAVREVFEETGIVINATDLKPLGEYSYRRGKPMFLFVYTGKEIKSKTCNAAIEHNAIKELDHFEYVDLGVAHKYINERLLRTIGNACFTTLRDKF